MVTRKQTAGGCQETEWAGRRCRAGGEALGRRWITIFTPCCMQEINICHWGLMGKWLRSQGKTYKPEEDRWLSKALPDFSVACLDNAGYNGPSVTDRCSLLLGRECSNTFIMHPDMARSQQGGDEAAFSLLLGNSQAINSDRFYF